MSLEVGVASAGGNESVLTKSFIIAAEEDTLSWYSMLKPKSIYSWENLETKYFQIFKGSEENH